MTPALVKVAKQLVDLQNQVAMLQRVGVDLSNSSFDGGSINQYSGDGLGVLQSTFGSQFDGSNGAFSLNGPPPPQPSAPTVTPITGAVRIHWDGLFLDAANAPLDFSSVEVHVSTDLGLTGLLASTLRSSIISPRGGDAIVPLTPDGTKYYAVLVARSQSGRKSVASPVVGPFMPNKVPKEDLGFKLADLGGNTIFFTDTTTTTSPTAGAFGDLWLKQTGVAPDGAPIYSTFRWQPTPTSGAADWIPLNDVQAADAIAVAAVSQDDANASAQEFIQATMPVWTGPAGSAVWFDSSHSNAAHSWDGATFVPMTLANGSFLPRALVASNVVATGSITASLLEALLILTNQIIAGDINGTHAKLDANGFHVYDVNSNEIIRLGITGLNDYFSIVDSTGMLLASIDETGQLNAVAGNFTDDVIIGGSSVSAILSAMPQGMVGYLPPTSISGLAPSGSGIRNEFGISSFSFPCVAGRTYRITFYPASYYTTNGGEIHNKIRVAVNGPVGIASTQIGFVFKSGQIDTNFQDDPIVADWNCTTTGMAEVGHSLELSWAPASNSIIQVAEGRLESGSAYDMGVTALGSGGQNTYGQNLYVATTNATTPPPTTSTTKKNYDTGPLSPVTWRTYRGDGSLRTDTSDVVQGYDPSGYNGDGTGHWYFSIPNITGTVTRVDFYAYANQTYYNSGGTGLFSPSVYGDSYPYQQAKGQWNAGNYPKPGGKWVTLPSDWFQYYSAAGVGGVRFDGVRVGRAGSTNETYYVRFTGNAARLRIWYTQ